MIALTHHSIAQTLQQALEHRIAGYSKHTTIHANQNLLELINSLGFAELVLEMESELDIELPLHAINLADIVHAGDLINFIAGELDATGRATASRRAS